MDPLPLRERMGEGRDRRVWSECGVESKEKDRMCRRGRVK